MAAGATVRAAALHPAAEALRGLLPGGVSVGAADLGEADPVALPASERVAILRAVPARRAEFAAGRLAARRAMISLGVAPCAVPMGRDRAPVWPGGLIGSIAHGAGTAIAAVACGGPIAGLGIDIEPDRPLSAELAAEILTQAEAARIARLPETARGRAALRVFCAKEAAYKAIHPAARTLLGFDAMRIEPERPEAWFAGAGGSHAAVLLRPAGPFHTGTRIAGRVSATTGAAIAGAWLAAPDIPATRS